MRQSIFLAHKLYEFEPRREKLGVNIRQEEVCHGPISSR